MKQVLVIKNERSLSKKIVSGLNNNGGFSITLHNEKNGLHIVSENAWDIIILDWDSLSISGPEICRKIRLVTMTPIIIVTHHTSSEDCIEGLRSGADDYIRKPFEKEELVARIKVVLRRSEAHLPEDIQTFNFRELYVNDARKMVLKNEEILNFTEREYSLLLVLIKNKNKILSREILLNQVWGYGAAVSPNVVDLYIGYLRKKINCSKKDQYIKTVHGRGYTMIE